MVYPIHKIFDNKHKKIIPKIVLGTHQYSSKCQNDPPTHRWSPLANIKERDTKLFFF